jgi:hypothetical protein
MPLDAWTLVRGYSRMMTKTNAGTCATEEGSMWRLALVWTRKTYFPGVMYSSNLSQYNQLMLCILVQATKICVADVGSYAVAMRVPCSHADGVHWFFLQAGCGKLARIVDTRIHDVGVTVRVGWFIGTIWICRVLTLRRGTFRQRSRALPSKAATCGATGRWHGAARLPL